MLKPKQGPNLDFYDRRSLAWLCPVAPEPRKYGLVVSKAFLQTSDVGSRDIRGHFGERFKVVRYLYGEKQFSIFVDMQMRGFVVLGIHVAVPAVFPHPQNARHSQAGSLAVMCWCILTMSNSMLFHISRPSHIQVSQPGLSMSAGTRSPLKLVNRTVPSVPSENFT